MSPLLLSSLIFGSSALAADVTDFPPMLRGDLQVDYGGRLLSGSLEESERQSDGTIKQWGYGRRNEQDHTVTIRGEFAAYHFIALNVGVETSVLRLNNFPGEGGLVCAEGYGCDGPTMMQYDPVSETGSYRYGPLMKDVGVDPPEYRGSGMKGVWLGAALQPFAERFGRNHHVTWRLDFAYRTANPSGSFWTQDVNGNRGAAEGGSAVKLGAAFSTDNGFANPYVAFTYLRENPVAIDYRDSDGTLWAQNLTIDPADKVDARGGVELVAVNNPLTGNRFAWDTWLGFGYRTWEDIPSGFLLANVLDQSKNDVVNHADHIVMYWGMGLDMHITKFVNFRVAGDIKYFTPHALESLYPVRSDYDTIEIGLNGSLDIRFRTADD